MLFGDPDEFAIEAGVEPDLRPPSAVWGFMRVWCRGATLGDIDERYCALYHSSAAFGVLADTIADLWVPELAAFDDEGKWKFLDGLLYGYHGGVPLDHHDRRTLPEVQADSTEYGRFNFLTNWGEQFDGFKSFIFRPPGGQVCVLSRAFPARVGLCARVPLEAFASAACQFTLWYREQERRLQFR